MENAMELIRMRRSVRTFDGRLLPPFASEALRAFAAKAENPWGVPVEIRILPAGEDGLTSPVIAGETAYAGAKVSPGPAAELGCGYSFEWFMLEALGLGLGSVWLGGTLNRPAFAKAMELGEGELMPCVTPLGYPAKKMSLKETVMRKATRADTRKPFGELFFDGDFHTPLTPEAAGPLSEALEAVRLAPSAVNKQPWRVLRREGTCFFYKKGDKGFVNPETGDLQKIDLGIAVAHFALAAESAGLAFRLTEEGPGLPAPEGWEFIAACRAEAI